MISRKSIVRALAGASVALAWGGSGCLSMQSQSSLDGEVTTLNTSTQPYVEAYVEYAGPQARWAGPGSFILHVTAKDSGAAQITTTPVLLTDESPGDTKAHDAAPRVSRRTPAASSLGVAGESPSQDLLPAIHRMSSEEARAKLAHLVNALQGAQALFHGCMSPVRVHLVRADGGILERQGCRSELGWSRAVSETVSSFIEASLHGTPVSQSATAPKAAQQQAQPQVLAPEPARAVASEQH